MPVGLTQTEQRQFRMQRERLADEFTHALNAFQATQRTAAAKVKEQVQKSRALAMGDPFAAGNSYRLLKYIYMFGIIFYIRVHFKSMNICMNISDPNSSPFLYVKWTRI